METETQLAAVDQHPDRNVSEEERRRAPSLPQLSRPCRTLKGANGKDSSGL